jgi:hypothetical protein
MFVGTHYDNMQDMKKKGRAASGDSSGRRLHPERTARGERASHAKLTEQDVRIIRERYASEHRVGGILAREYGVAMNTIYAIVKHKTWTHIE